MSENFTKEALVNAIKKAMNIEYNHDEIRKEVVSRFSYDIIAKQYIELYNQLLQDK